MTLNDFITNCARNKTEWRGIVIPKEWLNLKLPSSPCYYDANEKPILIDTISFTNS